MSTLIRCYILVLLIKQPHHNLLFSTDFIANSDHVYTFTNETNELRIATEIVDDLIAEYNEVIVICLPNLREYMTAAAESVEPSCVSVTLNDNDRKTGLFFVF